METSGSLADLYELEADDRPGTQKAGTHYMHLSTPAWEFPEGRVIAESAQPIPGAGPEDVPWLLVVLRHDDDGGEQGLDFSQVLRGRDQARQGA